MGILECLGWCSFSICLGWVLRELFGEDVKDSDVIYDYQGTRKQYDIQ